MIEQARSFWLYVNYKIIRSWEWLNRIEKYIKQNVSRQKEFNLGATAGTAIQKNTLLQEEAR